MNELKLNENQAALILEVSDGGEISVDIAVHKEGTDTAEVAADICKVIAIKLVNDQEFQEEIMARLSEEHPCDVSSIS